METEPEAFTYADNFSQAAEFLEKAVTLKARASS